MNCTINRKKLNVDDEVLSSQFGCISFHRSDQTKLTLSVKNKWSGRRHGSIARLRSSPNYQSSAGVKSVPVLDSYMSDLDYA
jgi:hypothetical protein